MFVFAYIPCLPHSSITDALPLLKLVLSRFFGDCSALVQAVVDHIPSPAAAAAVKIPLIYSGDAHSAAAQAMLQCESQSYAYTDPTLAQLVPAIQTQAPLMLHIAKLYPRPDASAFDAFGRVFSGTVRVGDMVRVLGEGMS